MQLSPGEELIKEGSANMQRGLETVGGKLYLTSSRLIFEPHSFNFQPEPREIPLAQIETTALGWTKFLNAIPLAPNALLLNTTSGEELRFTLFARKDWAAKIEAAIRK